jgi:GMP synthase (glutamine-hydrolysing)|tara:strand:- start:551 stop:1117 length:567 start_codon:yes stop_codon:yes gene_type:complete
MVDVFVIANQGQYNHRIYRTLKYLGVKSQLVQNSITPEEIKSGGCKGLIIGGGQCFEISGNSGQIIKHFAGKIPILGICLGHQLIAELFGGKVRTAKVGEYADSKIIVDNEDEILRGLAPSFNAWVSHKDEVSTIPQDFLKLAHSNTCSIEAMVHVKFPLYGLQFHPEVEHTPKGPDIFKNFLRICGL